MLPASATGRGGSVSIDKERAWDGIMDEARVMNVAKDASWLLLEYESQKAGSKRLTFGPTQEDDHQP